MPATYSVRIGPSCQKTSPIWAAIPTGPETGGAAVGCVDERVDELAQPTEDQPERVDVRWRPTAIAVGSDRSSRRRAIDRDENCAMPSAPWLGVDRGRSRSVAVTLRVAPSGPRGRSTVLPAFAEQVDPHRAVDELERCAVDRDDRVAGLQPGGRGRRIRLDLGELTPIDGHASQAIPREDHEREQDVHDDARARMASLIGRRCDEKERGSSVSSPSSPSSLTKPPIGSQFSV